MNLMVVGVFSETWKWLKEAKTLGFNIIATHPIDIRTKEYYDITKKYIDYFYICSYKDVDKLCSIAKKFNIQKTISHPCSNDAVIAAAAINECLGTPGVGYSSANSVSDKLNFHNTLEFLDLPRPSYCTRYPNDNMSFPCIVKPNFGAGSVGVKKIYDNEELRVFLEEKNENNGYKLVKPYDYYIIQEFVAGSHIIGCHAMVIKDKLHIFGTTKRDLSKEEGCYCYGQNFISVYDTLNNNTIQMIEKLVLHLKLTNTIFDLEILMDENNNPLCFIEMNLRPAELPFNFISGRSFEYVLQQQILLGISDIDISNIGNDHMGVKYFKFEPGQIKSIVYPSGLNIKLKNGDIIPPIWNVNVSSLCGKTIVYGNSYDDVENKLEQIRKKIQIEYVN